MRENNFMKHWFVSLFFLILSARIVSADLTVHIIHPWASDTARLNYGLYIQSSSAGWYPGTLMTREAGSWFTYTFSGVDSTTNDRFQLASFKMSKYVSLDSVLVYPLTSGKQLNFKEIITANKYAKEIWIYIDDITKYPRISTIPPKSKVIRFFNPWSLGAPRVQLNKLKSSIKMKGVPNFCGWLSYYHFDTTTTPVLRFVNSLDSSIYGSLGLGDSSFLDFSGLFTNTDTLWLLPTPYPNGPPVIYQQYPGKLADCTPITLAAKIWDIGTHVDFNGDVTGRDTGIVEKILGSNGKPVHNPNNKTVTALDDWFTTKTFPGGYTNERCVDITLERNDEGMYEYDTSEFFPIDDFKFLDGAGTIPNPNNNSQDHDYSFVMELSCEFEYVKGQTFYFRGDDDVWVFIDNKLAVDLGGIHNPIEGSVNLDTLGLSPGKTYNFKLFFAERHCCGSSFRAVTSINLRTSSRLFAVEKPAPNGGTQYDMFEKRMQGTLACDASNVPQDTVKAVVDFFIEGPSFDTPQRLLAGTKYGGIIISSDFTQIIINVDKITDLLPGDYIIRYYSPKDPSQSSQVTFTVTKIPKPVQKLNPVVKAMIYADNGTGKATRAEVYYQDTLQKMPDSVSISWPTLLQRTVVTGNSIVSDNTDKHHITINFGQIFANEATTFGGTDNLGISFTTDTAYANPTMVVPFKIKDCIGPLIKTALYYERTVEGPDTFLLQFSETIVDTSLIGSSLELLKQHDTISLEVMKILPAANAIKIITRAVSGLSISINDSIRFCPDGPVRDIFGNSPNILNRPIQLKIQEKPPLIKSAYYQDRNADGIIDGINITFDKNVVVPGVNGIFYLNGTKTSKISGGRTSYIDNNPMKVQFDVYNTFEKPMIGVTSGTMDFQITFDNNPDVTLTGTASDSAPPVLLSANLYEGIVYSGIKNVPDTLIVNFSENIEPISCEQPFTFLKPDTSQPYTLLLTEIKNKLTSYTFVVTELKGNGFPDDNDSVYINPQCSISDKGANVQSNPLNRRVLLKTRPVMLQFKVFAGPSPFDPRKEQLNVIVDPTVKSKSTTSIKVNLNIYDDFGNRLFYKSETGDGIIKFVWNGTNRNGRLVGAGTYIALVKMTDQKNAQTTSRKILIGVKSR